MSSRLKIGECRLLIKSNQAHFLKMPLTEIQLAYFKAQLDSERAQMKEIERMQ